MTIEFTQPTTPVRQFLVSTQDRKDGWEVVDLPSGSVLVSDRISRNIDAGLSLVPLGGDYQLPGDVRACSQEVLEHRLKGRRYSNDAKVSIRDVTVTGVFVCRGFYADQQVTNELSNKQVMRDGQLLYDAARLWSGPDGVVYPLSASLCANNLGAGVIASTSDGHVLLRQRALDLAVAPGRVDLTSSGSCDWTTPLPSSLKEFAVSEVRGELSEEAGTSSAGAALVRVVSLYRDLNRGGKPDVLCAARLTVSSNEILSGDDLTGHLDLGVVTGITELASALKEVSATWPVSTGLLLVEELASGYSFPHARAALETVFNF